VDTLKLSGILSFDSFQSNMNLNLYDAQISGIHADYMMLKYLGSMQRRTDKCVRTSTEESCSIQKSYEGF